ncbi:MAG: ribosomal protein S12 methylthiotransferase, partial [Gammaproteobacteria bacterium]
HVDKIIPLMAERRILPYLDIPFQHGSAAVLKRMRRPAATENNLERIRAWREICADITIRSTFIVGFPGETEEEFGELLNFLNEAQLDRVGCFQYSAVEGAKANEQANPIVEEIKQERWNRFMQTQAEISEQKLKDKVGRSLEVLIDEIEGEDIIGRSYADAPEIDGNVFVRSETELSIGDLIKVKIDSAGEYDLWGAQVDL